jgi:hypothetical protein
VDLAYPLSVTHYIREIGRFSALLVLSVGAITHGTSEASSAALTCLRPHGLNLLVEVCCPFGLAQNSDWAIIY